MTQADLKKAFDALTGAFSFSEKTISRWENGGAVQGPGLVWEAFQALRQAGRLPRGDLDAVGVALGQIEKGPENHQSPEESPDPSQGKDSPPTAPDLSSLLADLENDSRLQDPAIIRFSLDCACKAAAHPPLLSEDIYARRSTRQMIESFAGCWRVMGSELTQTERQALLISMAWLRQKNSRTNDSLTRFAARVRSGKA